MIDVERCIFCGRPYSARRIVQHVMSKHAEEKPMADGRPMYLRGRRRGRQPFLYAVTPCNHKWGPDSTLEAVAGLSRPLAFQATAQQCDNCGMVVAVMR